MGRKLIACSFCSVVRFFVLGDYILMLIDSYIYIY